MYTIVFVLSLACNDPLNKDCEIVMSTMNHKSENLIVEVNKTIIKEKEIFLEKK